MFFWSNPCVRDDNHLVTDTHLTGCSTIYADDARAFLAFDHVSLKAFAIIDI